MNLLLDTHKLIWWDSDQAQLSPRALNVLGLDSLPMVHRDPFDRLIISQARQSGFGLVSRDSLVAGYGVPIIW